ncbi:MAG TPA: WcbI family polysaccharide biosynthesis putative acetyltransferase [Rhizomicrobium sp.]|jgi:hypothetical protein|nr:WcbI family polysaccharide biosynthesis putative acetyltransferase [Rhizomicrobium sp.]
MKALVVTNCATAAYTSGLRVLFPEWEVKGANLDVAEKWLDEEPNGTFHAFLTQSDVLVLGSENEARFAEFAPGKEVLSIPYFHFRGLHPDCFHLGVGGRPISSVLKAGTIHSRLAVAAFLLRLPRAATAALFNGSTWERLGYYSVFEAEKRQLLERFRQFGIDLSPAFERWRAQGNFLYTYNHPKAFVFNDILLEALRGHFLDELACESARAALASVPDYLEPSIRWPVYPEIAARHGIAADFVWRTGTKAGPITLTRDDFIAETFDALTEYPELHGACVPDFDTVRAALMEQLDSESPRALQADACKA